MQWRVRTTFEDRPGFLAETAAACAAAGVDILGMQVFATGARVTDVFVVAADDGVPDGAIAALFESAGGEQVSVTRVEDGAAVDVTTQHLRGLREVLDGRRDVADVLDDLLQVAPPDVADYAGHEVLELRRPGSGSVVVSRAVPFTPVERERAQALVDLLPVRSATPIGSPPTPTSDAVLVRRATLDDVAGITTLHERCGEAALLRRYQVPLHLPMRQRMTRRLLVPDDGFALVVQDGSELVAHALVERVGEDWQARILVADAAQGSEALAMLVKHATRQAKGEGAARLAFVSAGADDALLRAVGACGFMARVERHDVDVHVSVSLSAVRAAATG